MPLIITFLIGLLVGVVAKFFLPADDPGGIIETILIGIAGSIVAGNIGRSVGRYQSGDRASFLASVGGADVLLRLYRLLFRRKRA